MQHIFDDSKLVAGSKKKFGKNTRVKTGAPLKLVGSASHQDEVRKNRLVEEILQRQAQLLQLADDAIHVRRFRSDRIIYWNHRAQKLYGWSASQAIGKVAHELLQTKFPEPLADIKEEVYRIGCWEGELLQIKSDGREIITESRWSLRHGPNGPIDVMEANCDLTDKKLSAQKVLEMDRLALLGAMAETFAHEVASPLTGISSSLQLLERDLVSKQEDGQSFMPMVRDALQEISRLTLLLNEFRSVASPPAIELKRSDL